MRLLILTLSLILLAWGTPSYAQILKDEPGLTWKESLMNDNRAISEWFDGMADGIDLFLAGSRYSKRKNDTRLTVETGLFVSEKEAFSDATSFNLNLRLPNVEEYWHLTFSTYDESQERSVTQTYLRQNARELDYGARLGFFKRLGNVRTAFQPRVGFAGRFKISHALSFESVAEKPNGYRVNPKLEFYADADRGPGTFMAFNVNLSLTPNWTWTLVNEGDYEDRTHFFRVTHGTALGHRIGDDRNFGYGIYFNFVNVPNYQLGEYIAQLNWSHMVYKNMLGYEIVPYVNFSNVYDYTGYAGGSIYLRLYF